jgi:hypothetical protein
METITAGQLQTAFAPDGYFFSQRRWVEKTDEQRLEGHTASLYMLFRKVQWNAWAPKGVHAAPHLVSSVRIDNLLSGRTRSWFGINKEDAAQVLIDLETDGGAVGAPAGWHVVSVDINNGRDGSISAVQTIVEAESELAGTGNLNDDVRLHPHDFQSGAMSRLTTRLLNFDKAQLAAFAPAVPVGYIQVSDNTDIVGASGQYDRVIVYEKVTWLVWGHDSCAYDIIEYQNVGLLNRKEGITKSWLYIRKADMQTAVTDLRSGTRVTAGYSIRDIAIQNHADGSITVRSTERKKETGTDRFVTKQILRPWGWDHCKGVQYNATMRFTGYETQAEAQTAATTALVHPENDVVIGGSTYKFIGYDESDDADGKYGVVYSYEYIHWDNDVVNPTFKHVASETIAGELDHSQVRQACALGKTNVDAAFAGIAVTAHPTPNHQFILEAKSISPQERGEFVLRYSQRTVSEEVTAASAEVVQYSLVFGERSTQYLAQRTWYRRTEAAKDILVSDGVEGLARRGFVVHGIYLHPSGYEIVDHHDTSFSVVQSGSMWMGLTVMPEAVDDPGWVLLDRKQIRVRRVLGNPETPAGQPSPVFGPVIVSHWMKRFKTAGTISDLWDVQAATPQARCPGNQKDPETGTWSIHPLYEDTPATYLISPSGAQNPGYVVYNQGMYEAHRIIFSEVP